MLKFKIEGQIISRLDDTKVVADSIDYLTASFEFPSKWNGIKTAVFRKGRATYSVVIAGDDCIVPWEVLEHSTSFTVSAFCGTRITTNTVHIPVIPSGYAKGDTPKPPTPDVYTQLTEEIDGIKETAQMADGAANEALNLANGLSEQISGIASKADGALSKANEAMEYASDMHIEVVEAIEKADNAKDAVDSLAVDVNNASSNASIALLTANKAERKADEAVSKLSSVYKYIGSVDNYNDLPAYDKPSEHIGEVYNVVNGKTEVAYGLLVTDMVNSGYGDNIADEYTYLNVDEANKFTVGNKVSVFNQDGKCLGSFVVQSTYETEVSEQLITGTGLYEICGAIAEEQGDYFGSGSFCDVHRKYYFSNIEPTSYDSKTLFSINPGANVAWTGADWDMLGGTVDLSAYATKDYVDTIIGTALEGEY